MTSDSDDLEKQLRQNLRLRRLLGAEIARAQERGDYQSVERRPRSTEVAETAPVKDDFQALRNELKLRRLIAAERAAAEDSNATESGARLRGAVEGPDVDPDNRDDLGELRHALKRRRELGGKVAKAKDRYAKSGRGMAYWLGQGLYWACLTLGLTWMAGSSFVVINSPAGSSELLTPAAFAVIIVPALLVSGIGRDLRYALSGT